MPMLLPSPDELIHLDRRQRDRVVQRLRAYEKALGIYVTDATTRTRLTAAAIAEREKAWGEQVRAEARRLAGEVGA